MTKKRDLKRLVRERQERTGESYTTARRHVVAHAAPAASAPEPTAAAIPVIEMVSFTTEAKRLGFACRVVMASTLASRVEPTVVLERVRDALRATADDPGTSILRAAALRGDDHVPRLVLTTIDHLVSGPDQLILWLP